MKFKNRKDAGRQLADKLTHYINNDVMILSIARGGVPLGYEIAKHLKAPLEVIIVRKLGVPHQEEYGIGAIAENNSRLVNYSAMENVHLTTNELKSIEYKEENELKRRISLYRNNEPLTITNKNTLIVVDDGLATGITMSAVLQSIRKFHPQQIIIAVPVCSQQAKKIISPQLRKKDTLLCLYSPTYFSSVSQWYHDFSQVPDKEVINVLRKFKN